MLIIYCIIFVSYRSNAVEVRWKILFQVRVIIISDCNGKNNCENWSTETKDVAKNNSSRPSFFGSKGI